MRAGGGRPDANAQYAGTGWSRACILIRAPDGEIGDRSAADAGSFEVGDNVESGMVETSYIRRSRVAGPVASGLSGSAWPARILWVLNLALVASALLFVCLTPDFLMPVERPTTVLFVASCLLSLASSSVGALVASRLPRNPVGWIFCLMGLSYGIWCLAEAYADYALLARPGVPLGELAAWASTWLRFSPLALGVLLVNLYPDGRLPSPRWRLVVWAAGGGAVLLFLGDAFRSGPLLTYFYVNNPFGIGGTAGDGLTEASTIVGGALLAASCLASIVSLALRLRLANGPGRRHLAWLAYAALPALLGSSVVLLNWSAERFGVLFLGKTLPPVLGVVRNSALLVDAGRSTGTLIELRLDATFEFFSVCAVLLMPVCTYVAMRRHGLYGMGGAGSLAAPRWFRVFLGGTIAGVLPLAFVYLAVFLYVVLAPLTRHGEPGREQLGHVVDFVGGWGALAFFLAITFLVAFRIARGTEERAVVLGTVVGLVAAFVDQTIASIVDPPVTPEGVASYVCLGLAGGYFGGLASRATLSGGVYRVSRKIGKAKDASTIASAIGENLGAAGVEGVAVWRQDDPTDRAVPSDARDSGSRTVLWGSWGADGRDGWPRGLDPGQAGEEMLAAPEERSWATVQRRHLSPGEKKSWEQMGIRSALLVPLVVPGEAWRGLLMVAFRKRLRFSGRAARAYLTVSSQASLALENLRLIEEAQRTGILVERQRLAREIHDTLAQGFMGVITNLTAAELAADPLVPDAPSARHIGDAKRIARDSLAEARRLVWALRPESLDRYSLPEALGNLVAEWSDRTGIEARGTTNGTPRGLLPEAEVALLRAAQESLANVHKHARATIVNVTLTYMEDRVVIDVLDDGEGFDPDAVASPVGPQDVRGFGLTSMRERVEQLGGRLAVETAPGEGTAIVVELRDTGEDR